jgi:hypothetical protein
MNHKFTIPEVKLPGNVVSFYIVPLPACPALSRDRGPALGRERCRQAGKAGVGGHVPIIMGF